jgi:hypothetical protein
MREVATRAISGVSARGLTSRCNAEARESAEESLATGKPVTKLTQVRLRTRDGFLWMENRFCFNGLRWYGVFRDLSKSKKTEARVLPRAQTALRCDALANAPLLCADHAARLLDHDIARRPHATEQHPGAPHARASVLLSTSDTLAIFVQVASQLLLARPLSPEARELLTAISASARVLLTLVNNVMLLKRLETGAPTLLLLSK